MREMRVEPLPDYREMMVSVGNNSTIRLRKMVYSVPSRLIGAKLLARIYEDRIVLLEGAQEVAQLPRVLRDGGAVIDFRHIIGHLLRKPGAFANYRWREELFPAPAYRATYDHLMRTTHEVKTHVRHPLIRLPNVGVPDSHHIPDSHQRAIQSAPRCWVTKTRRSPSGVNDFGHPLKRGTD
jgi:hypothetical protein